VRKILITVFVFLMAYAGLHLLNKHSAQKAMVQKARAEASMFSIGKQKLTGIPVRNESCHCIILPGYPVDGQGNQIPGSPNQLEIPASHPDFADIAKLISQQSLTSTDSVAWSVTDDMKNSSGPARFLRYRWTVSNKSTTNGDPP
jgi:hypothetical protein